MKTENKIIEAEIEKFREKFGTEGVLIRTGYVASNEPQYSIEDLEQHLRESLERAYQAGIKDERARSEREFLKPMKAKLSKL